MIDIKEPDTSIVRAWSALAAAGKPTTLASIQIELAGRGVHIDISELNERKQSLMARGYWPNEEVRGVA